MHAYRHVFTHTHTHTHTQVSARLPSRRLSFAESEYSLLLDLQPRQGGEDDEMLHSEDHLLLGGQESPRQAALEGQSA